MSDAERGLYGKYSVAKWNSELKIYEHVDDCFVLRPDRDPAAREALLTYASVTPNPQLAHDLAMWLARIQQGYPSMEEAVGLARLDREGVAGELTNAG